MDIVTLEDKYGNLVNYNVVSTFYSEKFKKYYLVYTDNTLDDDGFVCYYALSYNKDNFSDLKKITSDDEWIEIERVINYGT